MRTSIKWCTGFAGLAVVTLSAWPLLAQEGYSSGQAKQTEETNNVASLEAQAQQAVQTFKQKDPTLKTFFNNAAGYVVFPTVGEGAFIVGGAHGKGIVFQNGQPIGQATLAEGTVGAQIGGQSFSEVIFFHDPQSLQRFEQGNFEFSAGVNAVAANSGVGAATNYRNGVAVFTAARSGLMAKAAIGGQKFTYQPLAMGAGGLSGTTGTASGSGTRP